MHSISFLKKSSASDSVGVDEDEGMIFGSAKLNIYLLDVKKMYNSDNQELVSNLMCNICTTHTRFFEILKYLR